MNSLGLDAEIKGGVFVSARIKFYASDEEFEPKLTILWDEDILKILRYETLFYVEGWLCGRILSFVMPIRDKA